MMNKKMCWLHMTSWVLVLVGALNWGLVGLFDFNLVEWLLGSWPVVVRVVYVLVGAAALLMFTKSKCKVCVGGGKRSEPSMGGKGGGMSQ